MSCDIRKYPSMIVGPDSDEMTLTAFVGGKEGKMAIQFTIGGHYCALSQDALLDLVATIARRIALDEGFTATGNERDDIEYHPKKEAR